jgi:transcription termination/antitermination protein NusG
MNPWYALHVKRRFEQFTYHRLTDRGHEVLSPTYKVKGRSSAGPRSISLPLFPGYVFCRFDMRAHRSILLQPGVTSIVRTRRGAAIIDDSEIASLCRLLKCELMVRPAPYQELCEKVRILRGPLEGLVGVLARKGGVDRFIISISALERSVSIVIDAEWISPPGCWIFIDGEASGS